MAGQRKLSPERKAFINSLIEHYHPEDAHDVRERLKYFLSDTMQGMLEAEIDEKLGTPSMTITIRIRMIAGMDTVKRLSLHLLEISQVTYKRSMGWMRLQK